MSASTILLGLLPLLAFVLFDTFASFRAGVIAAVVFAVLEVAYTVVVFGRLDEISLVFCGLVMIFAAWAYKADNPLLFKIQPVVLGAVLGLTFIGFQIWGEPLFLVLMDKYRYALPKETVQILEYPQVREQARIVSSLVGPGFLVHALAVYLAARHLSNWWWLAIRGVGLYVMLAFCAIAARFVG